jgi:hypothetical protein
MKINTQAVTYLVQAVRRWFLTAEARVKSKVTACENSGGISSNGRELSSSASVFYSAVAPHSLTSTP